MKILLWNERIKADLTLRELSEKTGISKTTLNNIENQAVSPTMNQMELIAMALDVTISELYDSNYK